jgi:lipid A disaccharide synthetase
MDELESVLGKYLTGATIENMLKNPAEVNNTLNSLGHPELLQPFNEYKELLQKNAPSEPMKQKIEELQKEVENRKQTKEDIKQANESVSEEKILEAVDSDPDVIALREALENLSDDPTSIFGQASKQTVLDNL